MKIYHKIQSIYKRDPENNFRTFIDGDWSLPEFGLLKDIEWTFTEKIDGTNIRIGWDGSEVTFGGRSDNADIPAQLTNYLRDTFTPNTITKGLLGPATLIGEGYGGKIQRGGGYQEEQRFILFDVFIEPTEENPLGIWLARELVETIADNLSIPCVPVIHKGPLLDGIDLVKGHTMLSQVSKDKSLLAEGVVARPSFELRTRLGERIITKIKRKDFPKETTKDDA